MQLQPLRQWICDHCKEIIVKPEDGWVEWLLCTQGECKGLNQGFKIVHQKAYSTLCPEGSCYFYDEPPEGNLKMDLPLNEFIGEPGMVRLLSFIDEGPYREKSFSGPHVKDLREWTELVRRLMLPYYEEARLYMKEANTDGFFSESSEVLIYHPETLKEVIKLYGD